MTFLEKVDYLSSIQGSNRKRLSELSGIPYTTISNWYRRGYECITLVAFSRLCDYFNVTMDSMAFDDQEIQYKTDLSPAASPDTQRVAAAYDQADYFHQQMVKETLGIRTDKEKEGDASTA